MCPSAAERQTDRDSVWRFLRGISGLKGRVYDVSYFSRPLSLFLSHAVIDTCKAVAVTMCVCVVLVVFVKVS